MLLLRKTTQIVTDHELCLIAFAIPFLMFPTEWSAVGIGVIALSWLARWIHTGRLSVRTPVDAPVVGVLVTTAIGAYASVDIAISWPKIAGILLGIATLYAFANALRTEQDVHKMTALFIIFCVAASLFALLGTDWENGELIPLGRIYDWIPRIVHGLPSGTGRYNDLFNSREVGGAIALVAPVPLSMLLYGRGKGLRLVSALAVGVMVPMILLSQALSAIGGLSFSALILLVGRMQRRLMIAGLVGLSCLAALWIANDHFQLGLIVSSALDPNSRIGWAASRRTVIWNWALSFLADTPYTGIGLNTFNKVFQTLYPDSLEGYVAHAHQLFLQTALDIGVPGLLLFLWMLVNIWRASWSLMKLGCNPNSKSLLLGVAAGLVAYLVYGVVDVFTLGAKPGLALWAMMGLVSALAVQKTPLQVHNRNFLRSIRRPVFGYALIGTIVLLSPIGRGKAYLNIGTIQAHKAMWEIEMKGAEPPIALLGAARNNLSKALDLGVGSAHTYTLLGSTSGLLGDYGSAIEFLEKSAELHGEASLDPYPFQKEYWLPGRSVEVSWDRDLTRLQRVIESYPNRWEAYIQAASVLYQHLGKTAEAIEVLDVGIQKVRLSGPLKQYRLKLSDNIR